jgi:3',5'-cyclic AMP phosphodiesterase CpdA
MGAAADELLIAQISDTHLGSALASGAIDNLGRLDSVLDHLSGMTRRPDLLLVTGDLADQASPLPYRMLKAQLDRCDFPAYVCLGNRDTRGTARQIFARGEEDFFHYVVDSGPLRLVVLDTLEEGRHGAGFCEARADWLRRRLAEAPDRPTLIAMHHPPIDSGIDWVTTAPAEPWLARLDAVLSGQRQVVALVAGHIHRAITASRNGLPVLVCPPVSAPISLDLAPLDPTDPDGRALVADGPPGYMLHLWRGGTLTSHVDFVEEQPVLARFDERMQPVIQSRFAERP